MEGSVTLKKIWDEEYTNGLLIPSSKTTHPSSSFREFITQHSDDIGKRSMLDIGCGNGRNSIYTLKKGFKLVHGFDISSEAIKLANNSAKELDISQDRYRFYTHDLNSSLPEMDLSFDLAIDMTTTHLLNEVQFDNLFTEVSRVLKKSGRFLIFTIISNILDGKETEDVEMSSGAAVRYYIHDYEKIAKKYGFKIELRDFYTSKAHIGNNTFDRKYLKLVLVKI